MVDELCDYHKQHEEKFYHIEKTLTDSKEDLKNIWDNLNKKVSMTLFIFLVGLMIGSLGFQWQIYDSLKNLQIEVAVVKSQLMIKGPVSCLK